MAVGIVAGMTAWRLLSSPEPPAASINPTRAPVWAKIEKRLLNADQNAVEASERHLQRIRDFFADKRGHVNEFAEDVLGWGGKWTFVKGKLTGDDGKGQQAHMRQAFERHLFTDRDLQEQIQAVIASYLSELEGQENALLVDIRADLDDANPPALHSLEILQSDTAFQAEYRKMLTEVGRLVGRDLKITVGREAVVWVGSEVAAAATVRIGSAVAVRLGVSGGILGTGAASSVGTLGIGLVVGFVVDAAVDYGMRRAGYDPVGEIAGRVSGTLARIEALLLNGDPETRTTLQSLRHLQQHDRFSFVRSECRRSADAIESSGGLGLRHELDRLRQVRSRLREEALKKLILEGGTQ